MLQKYSLWYGLWKYGSQSFFFFWVNWMGKDMLTHSTHTHIDTLHTNAHIHFDTKKLQ